MVACQRSNSGEPAGTSWSDPGVPNLSTKLMARNPMPSWSLSVGACRDRLDVYQRRVAGGSRKER
ncbi:hypothetical protein GCM10009789_02750 [Kribbella sancticallisti]|uniref:Uncharacterized protein n=1 Tax=Kribbella sancticallisti TaxID=460087 RepID=A0ABP4N168_9ACTN